MVPSSQSAKDVLATFKLADNIYVLGCLEKGLTIYTQQVRALNLVWSMIEAEPDSLHDVAIVGGGFAGLTAAAGLLKKGAPRVAIFERHAALCPLQKGSDIRWVHPRIYEWPDEGSELPTAALPILNWNAGRASDVVIEILNGWSAIKLYRAPNQKTEEYTNVKHLRVTETLDIEWVGEKLGEKLGSQTITTGYREKFSAVILAVGFGKDSATLPYWRNEQLGQPEMGLGRRVYLVSGHGDGGLVDLFRIRIAGFRQDRILADLFSDAPQLKSRLRELKQKLSQGLLKPDELYEQFEAIADNRGSGFERIRAQLQGMLRADTMAVLKLSPKIDSFRGIFTSTISFQNRFLLFALYKAGGVIPYSKHAMDMKDQELENLICEEYGIKQSDVVRRHGMKPERMITEVLDKKSFANIEDRLKTLGAQTQTSDVCWSAGYWDERPKGLTRIDPDESTKRVWHVEYVPPATELVAKGFVAAVAGYLESIEGRESDFRVTLHRTLIIGPDPWLQQVTDYMGTSKREGSKGRTFPFNHGTIGLAAVNRQIARTRLMHPDEGDATYRESSQKDMKELKLDEFAQKMNEEVRSVLAVPMLDAKGEYAIAVLFADSTKPDIFTHERISAIVTMSETFCSQLKNIGGGKLWNFQWNFQPSVGRPTAINSEGLEVIEILESPTPPRAGEIRYLNVEFTDFIVAQKAAEHA
ncbi:MAG TPA: FAD-dependent oxidoreductase [Candidatus Solibacter sp.]|nr:FAD-dependent oxidoreductase [Candidatus Solibacter sp.]